MYERGASRRVSLIRPDEYYPIRMREFQSLSSEYSAEFALRSRALIGGKDRHCSAQKNPPARLSAPGGIYGVVEYSGIPADIPGPEKMPPVI
jgi:hypothetical protein